MTHLKHWMLFSLTAAFFAYHPLAGANPINGTFSGLVTAGNPTYAIGSAVTGTYSYGPNPADYSFVTSINANLFDNALGTGPFPVGFTVDANGLPNVGSHIGPISMFINPGGFLQFFLPDQTLIFAQVTYAPANAAPDAASTTCLLAMAMAGLILVRRLATAI